MFPIALEPTPIAIVDSRAFPDGVRRRGYGCSRTAGSMNVQYRLVDVRYGMPLCREHYAHADRLEQG